MLVVFVCMVVFAAAGLAAPRGIEFEETAGSFEKNIGQYDPQVVFASHTPSAVLWLTHDARTVTVSADGTTMTAMGLAGANTAPAVEGIEGRSFRTHYMIGRDPDAWRTNVPHYAAVRYRGIYPGIDVEFQRRAGQFEYDFIVGPSANPELIALVFEGADEVFVDHQGDLVLRAASGETRHRRPVVFQQSGQERKVILGRWAIGSDGRVGFELGAYDRNEELVIDPKLIVSSFIGGNGADFAQTLAYGPGNTLYVAGGTQSRNFPRPAGLAAPPTALRWTFINSYQEVVDQDGRLSRRLTETIFFGGSSDTIPVEMSIDASGNIHLVGDTTSTDLPVTNGAFQTRYGGGAGDMWNAVIAPSPPGGIAALGPARPKGQDEGPQLLYSTFVGGIGDENATDADLGECPQGLEGSCFFWTGFTTSRPFKTTPGAIPNPNRGKEDGVIGVTVPDPNTGGFGVGYVTLFGGTGSDVEQQISAAPSGSFCTGMTTTSDNLPVRANELAQALQPTRAGGSDVFIACFSPVEKAALAADRKLDTLEYEQRPGQATYVGTDGTDTIEQVGWTDGQYHGIDGGAMTVIQISPNVPQAFLPEKGRDLNVGHFYTLVGYEVVPAPANFFYSHAYTMAYNEPFTHTGTLATYQTQRPVEIYGGWTAGWDAGFGANTMGDYAGWQGTGYTGYWDAWGLTGARRYGSALPQLYVQAGSNPPTKAAKDLFQPMPHVAIVASDHSDVGTDLALGPAGRATSGFTGESRSRGPNLILHNAIEQGPTQKGLDTAGFPVTPDAPQPASGGGSFDGFFYEFYQPELRREAILDAGGFLSRDPAAGTLLTIFAFSIGAPNTIPLAFDDHGKLVTQLGLTRVLFDGEAAPMIFTTRHQVSAIAPYRLAGQETTFVQIEFDGVVSNPVEVTLTPANPSIFSLTQTGVGQGAILNPDFSVNSPENPSSSFIIVYGTGAGPVDPPCPAGDLGPSAPLSRLTLPQRVLVDGVEAQVQYGGSAPGLVCGVNQWNVIPTNDPSGVVSIQVCSGDACSQDGITAAFE